MVRVRKIPFSSLTSSPAPVYSPTMKALRPLATVLLLAPIVVVVLFTLATLAPMVGI